MTTVAADHRSGQIVSDSKCISGDTWSPMTKIFRHKDELIGVAGDVRIAMRWVKWYTAARRGAAPKLTNFEALILKPDGLYHVTEDAFEMKVEQGFYAIGSGAQAALAVMHAGLEPKEAVRIACLVDNNSGGALQAHSLAA